MLLLDGGDCFFPSPTKKAPAPAKANGLMREARILAQAYNLLGYEAMAVGPADLSLGLKALHSLQELCRFPFLCANLVDENTGETIFPATTVIEKAGLRFGVVGVMIGKLNSTFAKRALPGAKLTDPLKAAGDAARELKTEKNCDVVILLSQLNTPDTRQLMETVAEIDVVIDPLSTNGSKAIWVAGDQYLVLHADKPMLRIDGQGSRLGVFEMFFADGKKGFDSYNNFEVPLEPHHMSHPLMLDLIRKARRSKPVNIPFKPDDLVLTEDVLGQEACGGCHEEQHKFWQQTGHAKTYASLEKTEDQLRMDCVGCHSVGYGVSFAKPANVGEFKEVQCESCHGVKAGHAESPRKFAFGAVAEGTCWGCHNPAITEKNFDYQGTRSRVSCPKMRR